MQSVSRAGAQAETLSSDTERRTFSEHLLASMYDEETLAALCLGVYQTHFALAPFFEHILESFQAHHLNLQRAAILTLIPCVEGGIRSIAGQIGRQDSTDITRDFLVATLIAVQKRIIRDLVYVGYDWVPDEWMTVEVFDRFDEAIQIIESIKFFIEKSFYAAFHSAHSELCRVATRCLTAGFWF